MSPCCSGPAILAPIYYWTKTGRVQVAEIAVCVARSSRVRDYDLCEKPFGQLHRKVGGSKLTDEAWTMMLRYHSRPPYNFVVNDEGRLVPETAPQQRVLVPKPAEVKIADANQPEPIEFEPEFNGDEPPF